MVQADNSTEPHKAPCFRQAWTPQATLASGYSNMAWCFLVLTLVIAVLGGDGALFIMRFEVDSCSQPCFSRPSYQTQKVARLDWAGPSATWSMLFLFLRKFYFWSRHSGGNTQTARECAQSDRDYVSGINNTTVVGIMSECCETSR